MFDDLLDYLEGNCYDVQYEPYHCYKRKILNTREDKKIRKHTYHYMLEFLNKLKDNNVQFRYEIDQYIKPLSDIYFLLGFVVDESLNLFYDFDNESWADEEFKNAIIKLDDKSIAKAMNAYLQPHNREWCYYLAEDFDDKDVNI